MVWIGSRAEGEQGKGQRRGREGATLTRLDVVILCDVFVSRAATNGNGIDAVPWRRGLAL